MAGKRVLLVEGDDDVHVFKGICGRRQLGFLEIKAHGGKDALLDSFPVRLEESDIEAVGIVLDADTDPLACWQSVYDRLVRVGYQSVPLEPSPSGTVLNPPEDSILPRVGVWLMPDNRTTGILEDFLRFLIPQPNALLRHVESSIDSIPEEIRRFSQLARPKALIHTWLAWQDEPGKPMGQSITARFLDPTLPAGEALVGWLRQVFFPDNP
jgi:hypothetical protein